MRLLSLNFLLYTISGLWQPLGWSSKLSKFLYGIYTIVATYLSIYFMLNHMMDIILVVDNVENFALASFLFLSSITVFFKTVAALRHRDNIISVLKVLQEEPCKARNAEERYIQGRFDRLIRSYSVSYMILATFSCSGVASGGVMFILEGKLPFNAWIPWDYTSLFSFYFTSIQEIVAVCICTMVNISSETLIFGFCLQICAQFEILKYRLERTKSRESTCDLFDIASNKTGKLSEHIAHHICIIRLAGEINDIFSKVIFSQFFASVMVVCLSVYYLSSHTTLADIASWIIFVICMLVQIFVYCWAGNEITLQSIGMGEAVYNMDWTSMTISERKDLLMIMKRCRRPVRLTSSFLVTLSLDSYANLLKTSYSAFNLLQQS